MSAADVNTALATLSLHVLLDLVNCTLQDLKLQISAFCTHFQSECKLHGMENQALEVVSLITVI